MTGNKSDRKLENPYCIADSMIKKQAFMPMAIFVH